MELLSFRLCFLGQLAGSALMVVESILSEAVECEGGDGTLKAWRGAPGATVPHRRRFREVATPPPSRPLTQRPQELGVQHHTATSPLHFTRQRGAYDHTRCVPAGRPVFVVAVLLLRSPHELSARAPGSPPHRELFRWSLVRLQRPGLLQG